VEIFSDTRERNYTDSEKIAAILNYLTGLNLQSNFPENPDEYNGIVYVITITYEDGTEKMYSHFGNMFFGIWEDDTVVW